MPVKSDLPYCLLIQRYIGNILNYAGGMSKDDFCSNTMVYDACLLNFINIGEQTKNLSESFMERYPQIPYKKIIGLRNIAAHSYEGLEPLRLHKVIVDDLPELATHFDKIIDSGEVT